MDVIDSVPAFSLENGDTVRLGGREIEVLDILDCDTPEKIAFKGYDLTSGMVKPYEVKADLLIDILGA